MLLVMFSSRYILQVRIILTGFRDTNSFVKVVNMNPDTPAAAIVVLS